MLANLNTSERSRYSLSNYCSVLSNTGGGTGFGRIVGGRVEERKREPRSEQITVFYDVKESTNTHVATFLIFINRSHIREIF